MIKVLYQRGLELPELGLHLDPWDRAPFAFVSHAHSDHIGDHAEVIMTPGTARFMSARLPGTRREHLLPFGERRVFDRFAITLLAAGHIYGSAQALLEAEQGSLLYTGDFKLRDSRSAEKTQWQYADTLIMETTYGLPKYRMPPTEEIIAKMVQFCQEALEEGAVPVLLGYSLGKSQEILCALLEAGLTPMLHGAVFRMTELYRELRPDFPAGYVRYSPATVQGKVLVCPPSSARSPMLQKIPHRRTAVLTGWALDPGAQFRYGCDAAFPLTDHADYPDLIRYVELVRPKLVYTLHGFASAFAKDLRERGVEAWALSQENQLELELARPASAPGVDFTTSVKGEVAPTSGPADEDVPLNSFRALAELGERIAATTSKLRKIELLGRYLADLAQVDEEAPGAATVYLTGRPFPQNDGRTLQVGSAVIRKALVTVSGQPEAQIRETARMYSDARKTTLEVLKGQRATRLWLLTEGEVFFSALHQARGPLLKGEVLQNQLATMDDLSASYLVGILSGDLRIGLKEGLLEEAVAAAFGAQADEVREANMLLGNIGQATRLAARGALHEASIELFRPIKCMLASPEPTAAAIWERLQASTALSTQATDPAATRLDTHSRLPNFWMEDKFDGIRAQLHVYAGRVEIYTRDLRRVTEQFVDLAHQARPLNTPVILDGEIVAYDAGRRLTFFDLQRRLGRKVEDDLFLGRNDIPVIFKAFDLLWINGTSLLRKPLAYRRELLETLHLPPGLEVVAITPVQSEGEIEAAFALARQQGNEGLIAKDSTSLYTPGRRGLAWIKFKKELATLDVVVVGAETGHGKRASVLSDYTFAVRDEANGALLTIGKAYSGVTDKEIEELTEHFLGTTIRVSGKYREVRPEVVFEVAFDSVQPSTRHASGLALRFPRIKAIRRDKTPAEIDTLAYARTLVSNANVATAVTTDAANPATTGEA